MMTDAPIDDVATATAKKPYEKPRLIRMNPNADTDGKRAIEHREDSTFNSFGPS